jgi:hypothetical protein
MARTTDPAYAGVLRELRERCDAEVAARGGPLRPMSVRHGNRGAAKAKKAEG